MTFSAADHAAMARALQLAARGLDTTSPNPRVGCVIVRDGTTVGEGWHARAGEAHAEVHALRQAGAAARGATAYVTLEPCSHFGRTPPCADALIEAGVARVIAAMEDPNPLVAGRGLARLRASGIAAAHGLLAEAAQELNIGFVSRMTRGRPWVRLKVAASLDGTTALHNGASQWITSEAARADGHAWRARACAVLTGVGTVLADHPRLDVRAVSTPRQPHVVVLDSHLQTPPDAPFFIAGRACWIYAAGQFDTEADRSAFATRRQTLEARGAAVALLPGADGRVDLKAVLHDLARRGVNELHVEAGHTLNGALLDAGLVDELLLYLAPTLLGPGRGMADRAPLADLAQGIPLEFGAVQAIGPDLRVLARVNGRDRF